MAAPTTGTPTTGEGYTGTTPFGFTVTVPTHSEGDLLYLAVSNGSTRSIDSATGWTLIDSEVASGNALHVYYRIAGASEPATYDLSFDGTADYVYIIVAISGQAASSPVDGSSSSTHAGSGTATSPTLTVSENDSLLLRAIGHYRDWSAMTEPSGHTETADNPSTTYDVAVAVAEKDVSSGASGTADFSYTPTWHSNYAHVVTAIKPAAAQATNIDTWRTISIGTPY